MIDRRCLLAISVALLSFVPPVLAHEFGAKGITVAHPWARATPSGAKVGAAYLEIKADAKTNDRLIGAQSPVAARAEIHTHVQEGDVVKMRRLDALAIGPGKSVVLRPAGAHVMLMGLTQPLKEGDLIKLTLLFEKAGPIEVEATVEPIGAKGPHGLEHQPGEDQSQQRSGGDPTGHPAGHKH